jgi:hypothetical protein
MTGLKIFKTYDLVRSKIFSAGFLAPGPNQTFIEASKQKMFDGYALILDPVDPDVTDPTCKIMLSNGSTLRVRTEYLEILARYREV